MKAEKLVWVGDRVRVKEGLFRGQVVRVTAIYEDGTIDVHQYEPKKELWRGDVWRPPACGLTIPASWVEVVPYSEY
jgi:hypothetical protein